jgi:predicted DNA-binding transcriptional regulator AlpA
MRQTNEARLVPSPTQLPDLFESVLGLAVQHLAPAIAAELASHNRPAPASEPWRLLNADEVATRLGRSTRWVRERAKRGQLPSIRLDGGAFAFDLEDVQAFARARRISAREPSLLAERLHEAPEVASPGSLR